MRRRILITILLVTTFAVLAFLVPAAIAVRSGIRRSDLLALQREASIAAIRVEQQPDRSLDDVLKPGHGFGVYAVDGARSEGSGPLVGDQPVSSAFGGLPDEAYVGDELVAAAPLHREGEVVSTTETDAGFRVRARLADASSGRLSEFVTNGA